MPKIRNIIIFAAIAVALVLIYVFFFKPSSSDQANLVSSAPATSDTGNSGANIPNGTTLVTQDFLTLLLNVKHIKLDDSIFADPAFGSLHDSSITLVPDATTGRPNPFAQFGNDAVSVPAVIPTTPPPIKP
ncbi:hypothetical protein HY311_01780 [Candidatus Nomurabacteria bacterium]|nr:hypothetical protein [Candidatus Nomurabacteria bacterium]